MLTNRKYLLPFILITTLFFLWGFAHNLNPILIPHLKKACELTDLESALIDSAFYIGYFIMAIPSGMLMKKFGYKSGIVFGLLLFAIGAFLFWPAAELRNFSFFLLALFIIASGLTFLETAANPYITVLGEPETATIRLNFSQSFNGLAATLAPFLGGIFILSGVHLSDEQKANMSLLEKEEFLRQEALSVQIPYLLIGIIVLLVAIIIWRVKLPEISVDNHENSISKRSIWKNKNLIFGVIAQFFYVGAQVCVSSFFIRFIGVAAGVAEKDAAMYLSVALLVFMIGRFVGTFLMKYISPRVLLAIYSIANVILLIMAINFGNMLSIYALIGVEFFMSIMFPTIFSLSLDGLGEEKKIGSSLLVMAIAGGAFFPLIMGKISDMVNIQIAYIVPLFCFLIVFLFAVQSKVKFNE
ncbi:L-fucose:H+ symporter permease [Pedobacter glucosidilyticus]|uniref:L-fucose:H+ symporter permease n=1 Tax=Pedobacter glucosidilyticus TaxID=1122941 RepID=UPI0026EEA40F|nr:L-fucose:H+ symporter permease [Pedobacter glucosidilyticus]